MSVFIPRRLALAAVVPVLCLCLTRAAAEPREVAPLPRAAGQSSAQSGVAYDKALIAEIKAHSEIMPNLQHLSDVIGARMTGSKNAERANNWAADRMKAYGLEHVHLEPWEIPMVWERGTASLKVIDPESGTRITVAAQAWTPGTDGKKTGEVVVMSAKNKADLKKYAGKLKNAVVMLAPPVAIAPITDLRYGPGSQRKGGAPAKDEEKKEPAEPKKVDDKETPKKDGPPPVDAAFRKDLNDFLRQEGAACILRDSLKPHGLLTMTGTWGTIDRGNTQNIMPALFVAHEGYALLYRLATRPSPAVTRVEIEITNTFIPGPVVVYNTVGEVRGWDKPDEFVVVGAHIDSWDLATGTTDNGTGTCVVLETARAVATLAAKGLKPRRTIRFVLFTGEEQGLFGSKQYTVRHKDELGRISAALVHDMGTGKVIGFGLNGREAVQQILEPELETLRTFDGWKGTDLGSLSGSDHHSFEQAGVPGFASRQDIDEYRLTHHTQSDTFDHAKADQLIQGAQALAITAIRIANLPELLPRKTVKKT